MGLQRAYDSSFSEHGQRNQSLFPEIRTSPIGLNGPSLEDVLTADMAKANDDADRRDVDEAALHIQRRARAAVWGLKPFLSPEAINLINGILDDKTGRGKTARQLETV